MSIIKLLSSISGRKDKEQNKKLAEELAVQKNTKAIKELIENIDNKDKNIQSDCIDTLYEIGYRKPELIADYYEIFLNLIESRNNRMVWGGMIALSTIVDLKHKNIFKSLDKIILTIDKGSVITIDNGVKILIKLTKFPEYYETTNPLLIEQLWKCPIKQLPMYAERAIGCISDKNRIEFLQLLENRLAECEKDSQKKRIIKIIKTITIL